MLFHATINDFVGNLAEPFDFAVEYHLDNENNTQDDSGNSMHDVEQIGVASTYKVAGVADVEAADPSGSGDDSADADVLLSMSKNLRCAISFHAPESTLNLSPLTWTTQRGRSGSAGRKL